MSADTLTPDGAAVTLPGPVEQPGSQFPPGAYAAQAYAALPGQDEVVVMWFGLYTAVLSGYSLSGSPLFQKTFASSFGALGEEVTSPTVFAVGSNGEFGAAINIWGGLGSERDGASYALYDPDGAPLSQYGAAVDPDYTVLPPTAASNTPTGFHLEWITAGPLPLRGVPASYAEASADFAADGSNLGVSRSDVGRILPYAATALGGETLAARDNQVMVDGAAVGALPGEPANSVTDVAAAGLAGATKAAVAWVDSGTAYVSLFDAAANSFTPRIGLDWGGASDIHVVALPDGGFAVSWENGGAYRGEVFDAAGDGGGILSLAGDVAGVDSHGDLYTVGAGASGAEVVQTYAINGDGSSDGGGGTTGQTFNSDDNGDVWIGTAGNDVFNLGRGGDWAAGNGGNDTFKFAAIPWAGGHITDFNAGDVLDLSGLMSTTSDTGTDGFADGYLQITDDGQGDAQVWADYHIPGNDGWWLVETLDGVAPASLTHSGAVISVGAASGGGGGPTEVTTTDADYKAPSTVNSVTLAGSQQTVTANDAQDTTIWSNNTGNAIQGGTGDDTIHIGRGGDWVDGGAGNDVFVFDDIPWASTTIEALYPDQGDSIDVSGILAKAGYTGSDPIADGYLQISGNKIFANYHQPGNDGWWQVATVYTPGTLRYAGGGVIDDTGEHLGGTATTDGTTGFFSGADTVIMTGSDGSIFPGDSGATVIDEGSNNRMFGGKGNDTLVLGTSTTEASDHWGGVNTWVLNPQSTVLTHSLDGLAPDDRLDVRDLLSAGHYTGSDPVGDGYVYVALPPPPAPGELGDFVASQLMYDPDGAAGPAAARALFDTYYTPVNHFHYADGFFVVS